MTDNYDHNVFLSSGDGINLNQINTDVNFLNNFAFLTNSSKPLLQSLTGVGTPPPQTLALYSKFDNFLYIKDSNGIETQIGSGGSPLPDGVNWSDYLFWDTVSLSWQVGNSKLHLGSFAGQVNQGIESVALGNSSGTTNQGDFSVSIGSSAGNNTQGDNSVSIGKSAGQSNQLDKAIAVGFQAGNQTQGNSSIAIGVNAGYQDQRSLCVAIGNNAGYIDQLAEGIAIGRNAGEFNQNASVAIGAYAGNSNQEINSVSIGTNAGTTDQGDSSVAIGVNAGNSGQGNKCVSIGNQAGFNLQGDNSVCLGSLAGSSASVSNSIILNGSGIDLPSSNASLYVKPIRAVGSSLSRILSYDATTGEIVSAPTSASITNGTNYSNYLYWDDVSSTYLVGDDKVKLGQNSGRISQGTSSVAIGTEAGNTNQLAESVSIGFRAGQIGQGTRSVAIGFNTGRTNQNEFSVAIGSGAGNSAQGRTSVAVGNDCGGGNQGQNSLACGKGAGSITQGESCVALGNGSGFSFQKNNGVAIGLNAGNGDQGISAISIGTSAGLTAQGNNSVSIGISSGENIQETNCVAIGNSAGKTTQRSSAVSIGLNAGLTNQGSNSVSIGRNAGATQQATNSVSIGFDAGSSNQETNCVAIGNGAGFTTQRVGAISIGAGAGNNNSQADSISIGTNAGATNLQANCIAIGKNASSVSSVGNNIVLNATGVTLNGANSGTFIDPITLSGIVPQNLIGYNPTTKELIRGTFAQGVESTFGELETSSTVTTKTFSALNTPEGFFSMTAGVSNNMTVFVGTPVLPATFTILETGTYLFVGEVVFTKTVGGGSSNYLIQIAVNGVASGVGSRVSAPNTTENMSAPLSFMGFATAGTILELRISQTLGTLSTISLQRVNMSLCIQSSRQGVQGPIGPAGGGFSGGVAIRSLTSVGGLQASAGINGIPCNVGDVVSNTSGLTLTPTVIGSLGTTTQVISGFVIGALYAYTSHIAIQITATAGSRVHRLGLRTTSGVAGTGNPLSQANIETVTAIQSAPVFNDWCFGNNLNGFFLASTATDKIWFSAEGEVGQMAFGGNSASPLTINLWRIA